MVFEVKLTSLTEFPELPSSIGFSCALGDFLRFAVQEFIQFVSIEVQERQVQFQSFSIPPSCFL